MSLILNSFSEHLKQEKFNFLEIVDFSSVYFMNWFCSNIKNAKYYNVESIKDFTINYTKFCKENQTEKLRLFIKFIKYINNNLTISTLVSSENLPELYHSNDSSGQILIPNLKTNLFKFEPVIVKTNEHKNLIYVQTINYNADTDICEKSTPFDSSSIFYKPTSAEIMNLPEVNYTSISSPGLFEISGNKNSDPYSTFNVNKHDSQIKSMPNFKHLNDYYEEIFLKFILFYNYSSCDDILVLFTNFLSKFSQGIDIEWASSIPREININSNNLDLKYFVKLKILEFNKISETSNNYAVFEECTQDHETYPGHGQRATRKTKRGILQSTNQPMNLNFF